MFYIFFQHRTTQSDWETGCVHNLHPYAAIPHLELPPHPPPAWQSLAHPSGLSSSSIRSLQHPHPPELSLATLMPGAMQRLAWQFLIWLEGGEREIAKYALVASHLNNYSSYQASYWVAGMSCHQVNVATFFVIKSKIIFFPSVTPFILGWPRAKPWLSQF